MARDPGHGSDPSPIARRLRALRRPADGDVAHLERAAVQRFRAGNATVDRSGVGVAIIGQGTLQRSAAGVVFARSLACDEVRTGILAAPVVRGEVHTWLDLRTAFALGLGMALGHALIGLARDFSRRGR